MKKIRLVGKKLYRVGPLKCFKDQHHGHGTGGTYSKSRPQGYGSGSGGGSYMGSDRHRSSQGDSYRQNQQQAQQQRRIAAEKHLKKMEKDADDLINDSSPEGKEKLRNLRIAGDPDLKKAVDKRLSEIEGDKRGAAKQKKLDEKVSQNQLKNLLKKVVRGTIVKVGGVLMDAYDAIRDNPDDTTVNKLVDDLGVGHIDPKTITVSDKEVDEEIATGNYDNPENPNKFEGSPSQVQSVSKPPTTNKGGGVGGKVTGIAKPGVVGGPVEAKGPAGAAQPAAPATPAPPSAMEQLQRRARGEDSIVEKEAKLARDRALSSQLAAIKGARGATTGQKLRALRRGQEDVGLKLGAQTAIEKAKEQKEAQKQIIDYDQAQKERDLRLQMSKEKGTGPVGLGAAPSPGQSFGQKLQTGLGWIESGKKIFKEGKGLGKQLGFWEEGGKVEGPGSETSDSIPARLSDGEFVVKASAVRGLGKSLGADDEKDQREKGVDFLYKLQDKMDKKAKGGEINKKRFLASLPPKLRRDIANYEMDKIGFKRIRDARKKSGNEGFQAARVRPKEIETIEKKHGVWDEYAKGGEAYVRPKKAFREAIGYEAESRFHDKALKDAKFGGARRKFRHFKQGGEVSFGSVVSAKKRLNKNLEKLKRK